MEVKKNGGGGLTTAWFSLTGFATQALQSKAAAGCVWKGSAWSLRA